MCVEGDRDQLATLGLQGQLPVVQQDGDLAVRQLRGAHKLYSRT